MYNANSQIMKKNNTTREMKEKYVFPAIEVDIIEMKYGIATSSAVVKPRKPGGADIEEEWETEKDASITVDWPS